MGADPYKNCANTIRVKLSEGDGGFKKGFEIGSLEMDCRAESASRVCMAGATWKLGAGDGAACSCRHLRAR